MADYRDEIWKVLNKNFFQKLIGADKIILDLGAGWGEFINNIHAQNKYAIDLNDESASKVNSDVKFIQQDCSQAWPLSDNSLDVIFTSNFFEHLPTKSALDATLNQAKRCLKPGGRLICLGPNIKYVGQAYWDFYDHYIPLSHYSLIEALEILGFDIVSCKDKFLPFTMARGTTPPLFFVKLYLMFPVAWKILGKQFLIVAQKP